MCTRKNFTNNTDYKKLLLSQQKHDDKTARERNTI